MKTDTQVQHDVLAELEWEPSIDASKIGVTAKDRVVTLSGNVANYAAKMTAERVAKRVYGVQAVANDLEVLLPGSSERGDADIAAAALNVLKWNTSIPQNALKVIVSNGYVTLEGQLDWAYQKVIAERVVRNLIGVRGLSSLIALKTRAKPGDVKNKIEAAFKRNAELDARRVGVESVNGKVILRGNVHSWAERDEAEEAAWAAPGVSDVDNRLTVTP